MPRYIDADALIDFLDVGHLRHPSELCFSEIEVANLLLHAPTLSPDDVRGVGEWIEDRMDYRCSACGETVKDEIFYMFYPYRLPKFCPNCGARMTRAEAEKAMEVSEDA